MFHRIESQTDILVARFTGGLCRAVLCCCFLIWGSARATAAEAQERFRPIFDGQTLEGWTGEAGRWRVEDGHIVGEWTPGGQPEENTFLIWEGGELADFELRLRFRFDSEAGNSGIQIRSERLHGHVVRGYQPDIATEPWITGVAYEERGRGVLARRGERTIVRADGTHTTERFANDEELAPHIDPHEWTDYHVVAVGNRITIRVNGLLTSELIDDGPEARRSGIVALQLHRGTPMTIRFSNIEVKVCN